jgi:hypothetical protein
MKSCKHSPLPAAWTLSWLLVFVLVRVASASHGQVFLCPELAPADSIVSICSGDDTQDFSVFLTSNVADVQWVRFSAPQSGTSMYSGGVVVSTTAAADLVPAGSNGFQAMLENVVFPSATAVTKWYLYAIIDSADPDIPPDCRPFAEIQVFVHPTSLTLLCNNSVQVSLDSNGQAIVQPQDILNNVTYPDYGIFDLQITVLPGGQALGNRVTCAQIGQTVRARLSYPCSGNSCTTTLRVQDKLPPVLRCEDIPLTCAISDFTPAYLKNTLGIEVAIPTATDNCGPVTLTQTETWMDLDCETPGFNGFSPLSGYLRRRWTARDAHGNTSACQQYLYDFRSNAADVQVPPDTVISCTDPSADPNVTGVPWLEAFGHRFLLMPNTSYCELNTVYADQELPGCDGSRKILRRWTIYSWCEETSTDPLNPNPRYHTQIIEIKDLDGPSVNCPDDLTVSTNPNTCCGTINLPDLVLSDDCSRIASATATVNILDQETGDVLTTMTFNGTLSDFPGNNLRATDTLAVFGNTTCLPVGFQEVNYLFTDDCGNQTDCVFYIGIDDGVPPVAVCDAFTEVSIGADSIALLSAKSLDDGSYDNCSPALWYKVYRPEDTPCFEDEPGILRDDMQFCCADAGDTIMVTLRVYDVPLDSGEVDIDAETGHYNECMVRVSVSDKLPPVCTPPPPVTVNCESFDPGLSAYGGAVWTDNCCVDAVAASVNYTQFDTVCSRGTLVRTFRAADCHGNSASCSQRIVVTYGQRYFVKMPDDVILTGCQANGDYGKPAFFGQDCELLASSFADDTFRLSADACLKIERTWKIINWCNYNPNGSCVAIPNPQPNANINSLLNLPGPIVAAPGTPAPWTATLAKINPSDPAPTDFSSFWRADVNCYTYRQTIRVVDVQPPDANCPTGIQSFCDLSPNDTGLWNETYWWEGITASHNLCEGPADLKITASDACTGADVNIRFLLFLDLNQDGTLETVLNSAALPPVNTVFYGNAFNVNYAGGEARRFDRRNRPFNEQYRFALHTTITGGKKTAAIRWTTNAQPNNFVIPELPYGRHKIKWIITDGCGTERVCEYTFIIRDCKKPVIVCKPLTVNIMQTGSVSLWSADFLQYAEDNCTPAERLGYGVIKEGESTGSFPTDPFGNPRTNVSFSCSELGTQIVQLWARDLNGNADFCLAYVLVQDNMGNCIPKATVAGTLQTEIIEGVEDASVTLQGSHPALPPLKYFQISDSDGLYRFHQLLPIGSNYQIVPLKTDNPLNGVTTLDLSLISKHILGQTVFTSPYKMIAADANKSNTITTLDIVELRRLILGISSEFSNNTSWRFVPRQFVFTNPNDAFATPFPESISVMNAQGSQWTSDFVGIKVGDVNDTALPNPLSSAGSGDRYRPSLILRVRPAAEAIWAYPGQEMELIISSDQAAAGFQTTLLGMHCTLLEVQPGAGMRPDHFALHTTRNALSISWNTPGNGSEKATFSVRVRVEKAAAVRSLLRLSNAVTPTEAYLHPNTYADLALQFDADSAPQGVGFEVYANSPNPFVQSTLLNFHLPEAARLSLRVFDLTGRLLYMRNGDFEAGYGHFKIDEPGPSTTLVYRLESPWGAAEGKMVRMNK